MVEPSQGSSGGLKDDDDTSTSSMVLGGTSVEQVSQFLLSKNLLLTALELLVEGEEVGLGEDVTTLREFFHDTGKFDPGQMEMFQGEDVLSGQALSKEREEKLGLAEYELRVAQEDKMELQERLKKAMEQVADGVVNPSPKLSPIKVDRGGSDCEYTPSQQEVFHMNGGVLAHLLHYGYRVTAMTLREEAQGQIDSAALGNSGSASQPLWEHYQGALGEKNAKEIAEAALKGQEKLQDKLDDLQRKYRIIQEKCEATQRENQMLRSDMQVLEEKLAEKRAEINKEEKASNKPTASKVQGSETERRAGNEGTASVSHRSNKIWSEESRLGVYGAEAALLVIASAVPKIVPNVLINKREDLVPVIISLVQEHPDSSERDRLCGLLFNLVKRPSEPQRKVIIDGCVALAKAIGVRRTAEELLPQCWEQVNHKYAERRTLVAGVMGALMSHMEEDIRCSLVISILEQLCSDGDAEVRHAALVSLISVLNFMSGLDKYRVYEELLISLTMDPSDAIAAVTMKSLLPAVLNWIWESDKLYMEMMPGILAKVLNLLTRKPFSPSTNHQTLVSGDCEMLPPSVVQQRKILSLIVLYCKLLPVLRTIALKERPAWAALAEVENDPTVSATDTEVADGVSENDEHNNQGEGTALPKRNEGTFGDGAYTPDNSAPGLVDNTMNAAHSPTCSSRGPIEIQEPSRSQQTSHAQTASLDPENSIGSTGAGSTAVIVEEKFESISETEACTLFGQWVEASDHQEWKSVEAVAQKVVPLLLCCIRNVSPVHECRKLRKRLIAAVKLTCGVFGEIFTSRAIEPQFISAAGMPSAPSALLIPDHVAQLVVASKPGSPEATRIGRSRVLPTLLAGVLPQAGKGRLGAYVRALLMETTSKGHTWVLQHKKEALAAMEFAGLFPEANQQLIALLNDSVKSPNIPVKRGAAVIAKALVASLSAQDVLHTILPGIGVLSSFWDVSVQVAGVEAMESIAVHCANHPEVIDSLHIQCDKLVSEGAHEVQIAVIQSLTAASGSSKGTHMEFLLKQVLLILARMHQKATAGKSYMQLQEMALAVFQTLRTLDGCEIEDHNVRLYLVAALESLQREAELLDPTQRQLVSTMLADQSDMTPALQVPHMAQKPSVATQSAHESRSDEGGADS